MSRCAGCCSRRSRPVRAPAPAITRRRRKPRGRPNRSRQGMHPRCRARRENRADRRRVRPAAPSAACPGAKIASAHNRAAMAPEPGSRPLPTRAGHRPNRAGRRANHATARPAAHRQGRSPHSRFPRWRCGQCETSAHSTLWPLKCGSECAGCLARPVYGVMRTGRMVASSSPLRKRGTRAANGITSRPLFRSRFWLPTLNSGCPSAADDPFGRLDPALARLLNRTALGSPPRMLGGDERSDRRPSPPA